VTDLRPTDVTRHRAPAPCCALLALMMGLGGATTAVAQAGGESAVKRPRAAQPENAKDSGAKETSELERPAGDVELAARPANRRVPVPDRQLPDLGRLEDELRREATVERFLDDHDLRHLVAVRSYVDRTGRVADRYLQDDALLFDDSRDTVQQAAKEALRDYVKHQVGWEQIQDRMRIRVKNFFQRGSGAGAAVEEPALDAPAVERPRRARRGMGAFEISPQLGVDLDDSEIGLDLGYDPGDSSFWSRWELSYGQHLESDRNQLQLRYATGKRWMELTAGSGDDYQGGDFVAVSFTALF
jgi:hypothetical protein